MITIKEEDLLNNYKKVIEMLEEERRKLIIKDFENSLGGENDERKAN